MFGLSFIVLAVAAAIFVYIYLLRPWHLIWGASLLDRIAEIPGDKLSPYATAVITRAINVNAPPEAVWPWLMQIGNERAGFYSYGPVESLAGRKSTGEPRIVPEWQRLGEGDTVCIADPERYGSRARRIAAVVDPAHALVLVKPADWARIQAGAEALDSTWAIALRLRHDGGTRLISRMRASANPTTAQSVARFLFWEPAEFLLERRMLLNIQALAEKHASASADASRSERRTA